ncbi:MAG: penicillin acylase family protein [Acidobacteria bacterium]|nr:penicillin acylase family protein [Acidobacteriota bacterium]
MLKSIEEAVVEAKSKHGADPSKWRWGSLHKASFNHSLSNNQDWKALMDLQEVERGGDANTVNNTSGPGFRQNHGASYRQILDVGDWDNSVGTNVPGQSAQPGSRHYGDLLPMWADGKYFPLLFSRQKVESMSKDRLVLEP